LTQLRYEDEIRPPQGINLPSKKEFSEREMKVALMLIDQLSDHFKASDYKDTFTEEIEKIIESKKKGKPIQRKAEEPATTEMRDLMEMLKRSLEAKEKTRV
jgi:DNA end-binding protein Ku